MLRGALLSGAQTARRRPPRPKQGEALRVQAAGHQAIPNGFAGGYRSHILVVGKWTIWRSSARQAAFPPHTGLLHDGQPLATGVLDAHHMCPHHAAATGVHKPSRLDLMPQPDRSRCMPRRGVMPSEQRTSRTSKRGQGCMPGRHHPRPGTTSAVEPELDCVHVQPSRARIVICTPECLLRLEATILMAHCTLVVVKALKEGDHQGPRQGSKVRSVAGGGGTLRRPGAPAGVPSKACTNGYKPYLTCGGGASLTARSATHTGRSCSRQICSATPSVTWDPRPLRRGRSTRWPLAAP